ncbi:CubicO group peptidase (beta-lactamase class C family) [Bradyrhizobium diazoefficiens]
MSSLVTLRSLSISRRGFARAALLPLAIGLIRPREAAADSDMIAQMRDIVANELAPTATPDQPGGLAAALYAGRHVEFFNYGFADDTMRRPVTSDTLFNLGSLRKPFEATLVALGTLRGELRLDDRLPKYLPELTGDSIRRVTVGELVTHTSGLLLPTDHPPWPNEEFSRAQFIEMLNAWRPQSGEAPGKQRIYSHAGYVLLQLVLERCYGTPIATQLEQRIFKPLGMTATSVPERGEDNRAVMDAAWMQRVVQGYSDQGMAIGPPGNQQSYFDFPRHRPDILFAAGSFDLRCGLRRWPLGRPAFARGAEDDAARDLPRRREIRARHGVGDGASSRGHRRRQAGRPQQRLRLSRPRAGAADRHRAAGQSRRISARDRALQDPARAGEARGLALKPALETESPG